jgi:methyl acetate hydrolase
MIETGKIDRILQQATDAGAVPGVVAMAADASGIVYEGAFGRRSLAGDAPMSLDTVFWTASMTKAVTSVAAMQLVEQGRLSLDAPIGPLLPGLAAPQVLEGFDADGQPRLRPAVRPVTLRHLLTHTAGFSYNNWNPGIGQFMAVTGLPATGSGELAALAAPLIFEPGERWEYGINTDWAGQAIEAASGQSLDACFRERIFAPLGMADSGFVLGPGQRVRRATSTSATPMARSSRSRSSCLRRRSSLAAVAGCSRPRPTTWPSRVCCWAAVVWATPGCCGPRPSPRWPRTRLAS